MPSTAVTQEKRGGEVRQMRLKVMSRGCDSTRTHEEEGSACARVGGKLCKLRKGRQKCVDVRVHASPQ